MKIFLTIFLTVNFIYAGLINAIAFKVDNNIVTLYDIDEAMSSKHLSKQQAMEYLTIEILKKSAIKKLGIIINDNEVDAQIRQISARNGMDIEQFKSMLSSRFIDYNNYHEGLKKQMLEQKLFARISQASITKPSEEELVVYYNTNKEMFAKGGEVEVVKYSSANQQAIAKAVQSPLMVIEGVEKENLSFDLATQSTQIVDAINKTQEGAFSPLLQEQNIFATYFVKTKTNTKIAKFEDIKTTVLNNMMQDRQRVSAMIYFQKLKSQSNIEYIR